MLMGQVAAAVLCGLFREAALLRTVLLLLRTRRIHCIRCIHCTRLLLLLVLRAVAALLVFPLLLLMAVGLQASVGALAQDAVLRAAELAAGESQEKVAPASGAAVAVLPSPRGGVRRRVLLLLLLLLRAAELAVGESQKKVAPASGAAAVVLPSPRGGVRRRAEGLPFGEPRELDEHNLRAVVVVDGVRWVVSAFST